MKRQDCELKSYILKTMLFWTMEESDKQEGYWLDPYNLPDKLDYLLASFLSIVKEGN